MNSKFRRLITLFLVVSIIFGTSIVSAYAYTESESFEYTIENGEVIITGYNGTATELSVPSTIKGYPVTAIAENAFKDCTNIENFSIPTSVTSIGANAFFNTEFYDNKDNWENNVLYIDDALIEVDYNLVGPCAIKDGTRVVADYAFMLSNSVSSITVPATTKYIGKAAFINCDKLTEINVNENNPCFTSVNGVLFNESVTELITYPNNALSTIYTIPDGVTSIADKAFMYSLNVSQIVIPSDVNVIGEYAFSYCTSLTKIKLPDNLKSLPVGIFDHCTNLKYVTFPSKIESISDNAFKWCTSLVTLTLPNNIKTIGTYAFYNCRGLEDISISDAVTTIENAAFYNCKDLTAVNYSGDKDAWNKINIEAHNDILDEITINYNVNINGSTGSNIDLPDVTEPITEPTVSGSTEETTVPSTTPSEKLPDTKWLSIEMYNSDIYSTSSDNQSVGGATYNFYHAPVNSTLCATATTIDNESALVMSLDSDLPFDFNIGDTYYVRQEEVPYGYVLDELWYMLEVTERGWILTDCATEKRVGYSNNNNTVKLLGDVITGTVTLHAEFDGTEPSESYAIDDYSVKNADTNETLYFDIYYQWKGYSKNYGSSRFTLYSDEYLALYNIPVGKYYFEKIVEENEDVLITDRIYFEIKPNESGDSCDITRAVVKVCNPLTALIGDANNDGKLNVRDATTIQKYLAHIIELDENQMMLADFDGNGKISIKDATAIQKEIAGF